MVCMALICFLSTECVTSIYVLGFNYRFNYHIPHFFYFGIEVLIYLLNLHIHNFVICLDGKVNAVTFATGTGGTLAGIIQCSSTVL